MAVVAGFSVSLDGFVADLDNRVGPLFDWMFNGPVEVTRPGYPITYTMSPASARYWTDATAGMGALVCGRRVFDHGGGWGGRPPGPRRVFVVTHRPPVSTPDGPVTFVTTGVADAVARAKAADVGGVGVCGPSVVRQCLALGLLDELRLDLVPVLLGGGVRCLDNLVGTTAEFHRTDVVGGDGVTHLRYRVTYR
ncbi:dihydrofolate reductase family protein [Kibdelosporangium lantanae]